MSLGCSNGARRGEVIASLKLEKFTDGGDLVALTEEIRVEIENVGECKAVVLFRFVGISIAGAVLGLGDSKASSAIDELVERKMDPCRERLRLALRCGTSGGGLVLWDSSACGAGEKLLPEPGVAGGEGGRSGGNP